MTIKIEYEVKVVDKDKILQEVKGESRTATTNFFRWLRSKFIMVGGYSAEWSAVDLGGTTRTFPRRTTGAEDIFGQMYGSDGASSQGIIVGRGTTPYSPHDFRLADQIPHGTSVGQLYYGVQSVEDVQVIGNTILFAVSRPFHNQTTSDVTVNEIGIALGQHDSGGTWRYMLVVRDVLPSPVVVPPGRTLVVRYIFRIAF